MNLMKNSFNQIAIFQPNHYFNNYFFYNYQSNIKNIKIRI